MGNWHTADYLQRGVEELEKVCPGGLEGEVDGVHAHQLEVPRHHLAAGVPQGAAGVRGGHTRKTIDGRAPRSHFFLHFDIIAGYHAFSH